MTNRYVCIRLGWAAFPCGATIHDTQREAEQAAIAHAEANRLGITSISDGSGEGQFMQITTDPGKQSYRSYIIVEAGGTDVPEFDFTDHLHAR